MIASELKGIACEFVGYSPPRADEGVNVHAKRNLSLQDGVLTIRNVVSA